jgi:hypothetical protein
MPINPENTVLVEQNRWNPENVMIGYNGRWTDLPHTEVPALITALRRAYNNRPQAPTQSDADGVVASVLLQTAVANAPGDFS